MNNFNMSNKSWDKLLNFRMRVVNYMMKEYDVGYSVNIPISDDIAKMINDKITECYSRDVNVPNTANLFASYIKEIFPNG